MRRRQSPLLLIVLSIGCLFTTTLPAHSTMEGNDPEGTAPESEKEQEQVDLDLENASIPAVLRMLGRKYGRSIVIAPEIKGTVSAHIQGSNLDEALQSLLTSAGLSMNLNGDIIEVSPYVAPTKEATPPERLEKPLIPTPIVETRILQLQHSIPVEILPALSSTLGEGIAVPGIGTHTLILTGTFDELERADMIVKALDRPRKQVRIESKMLETTLGESERLGIDWNMRIGLSGAMAPTTFPFDRDGTGGSFRPHPDPEGDETNITSGDFSSTTTNNTDFPEDGFFPFAQPEDFAFGMLDFRQFSAVIEALEVNSDTRLVASPQITATENIEALIHIGEVVPIPEYSRNEQYGVTTVTGYTEIKVGTSLTVTPRINGDGTVTLKVIPEVSAIIGFTGPDDEFPITSNRRAETEVTLLPGRTLVIGGLVGEKTIEKESQVPILGSIPLIGELFSYSATSIEKSDLLIFITPRLVDIEGDDLEAHGLEKMGEQWVPSDQAERLGGLLSDMGSQEPRVRAAAFDRAAESEPSEHEEAFGISTACARSFREDPEVVVRASALRALSLRWPTQMRRALEAAVDRGEIEVLEPLAWVAIEEESLFLRANYLSAMAAISRDRSLSLFEKHLRDHPEDAKATIECLGLLGDATTVPTIVPYLSHEDGLTSSRAIEALGRLGGDHAAESLYAHYHQLARSESSPRHFTILALRESLGGDTRNAHAFVDSAQRHPLSSASQLEWNRCLGSEPEGTESRAWTRWTRIVSAPIAPKAIEDPLLERRLGQALDILKEESPYHHEFVQEALSAIHMSVGSRHTELSANHDHLAWSTEDLERWSSFDLAHQLVFYAVPVKLKALGMTSEGPRAKRIAYREQYLALRTLAGDPNPSRGDLQGFLEAIAREGLLER